MNIFFLDKDPVVCARMHVDKHVVKMILEYAQLMSTAHRILDGCYVYDENSKRHQWVLNGEIDTSIYRATHMNHPSAIWARGGDANYAWLYELFSALNDEYSFRYEKLHASRRLMPYLMNAPKNISNIPFSEPTPAMPAECIVIGNSVESYRNYYNRAKSHIFFWKKREIPFWINS